MKCFLLICIVCKLVISDKGVNPTFNVGTVLFASEDARKELWTLQSVELLKARKHFQRLITPMLVLSQPMNDKNLNALLKYLDECYNHVNRSTSDEHTDTIMTAAASDVIGGFIKCYIVPVTKYAFYGGVVSTSSVEKLFNTYNRIKNFLHTDGASWQNLDQTVLDNIVIDVAGTPLMRFNSYLKSDPCKRLGYFEKTEAGLLIPMPKVNWDVNSLTMFLPLKNESLISLLSLDAFNTLLRYYVASKACAGAHSQDRVVDFEDKFQTWLVKDVVPHLSDDEFYPGLGGVLSLINLAKLNQNDKILDFNPINFTKQVADACGVKVSHLYNLLIILILVWICIPASVFLYCQRKFKKVNKNLNRLRRQSSRGANSKRYAEVNPSINKVWNVETYPKTVVSKSNKNKKSFQNNTDPILTKNESVMTKILKDCNSNTFFKLKPFERLSSVGLEHQSASSQPSTSPDPSNFLSQSHTPSQYTTCSRTLRMIEESQDSLDPHESEIFQYYEDPPSSYVIEPTKTVTLFRSERERPYLNSRSTFSRTVSDNIEAEAALINAELAASDIQSSTRRLDNVANPFLFCINEVDAHSTPSSVEESVESNKTSIVTSKQRFANLEIKPTVRICMYPQQGVPEVFNEKPEVSESPVQGCSKDRARPSKIPKWSPPVKVSTPRDRTDAAVRPHRSRPLVCNNPRPLPKSKLPKRLIQDDTALKSTPMKKEKLNATL